MNANRPIILRQLDIERSTYTFDLADQFEYRPEKGWRWLQRACFSILRRIGAFGLGHKTEVKTQVIDPVHFSDAIGKQLDLAELYHMREQSVRVYMGPDDFAEVMREAWGLGYGYFNAEIDIRNGRQRKLMGLDVHVVPWMRGILVAP